MALDRADTNRIIRFCLAGVGWGSATHEDEAYVVKIVRSDDGKTAGGRFEGRSYEEALREAARAGAINARSVEKQMAFFARVLPSRAPTERDSATPPAGPGDSLARSASQLHAPFSELTRAISGFLTEAQRERGISALYLSSAGRLFGGRLRAQARLTDERLVELRALGEGLRGRISDDARSRLERALGAASTIAQGRRAIEALAVSAVDAIAGYSSMNAAFLAVIDALASRNVDATSRPTAFAWMALLYAKEKTGIERAQLASAFACDHYVDGQYALVSAVIAASDSYLHLFSAAAPAEAQELMRTRLESGVAEAVADMERIALRRQEGGFGVDPEAWFSAVSQKMDLFGDVESVVRTSLA